MSQQYFEVGHDNAKGPCLVFYDGERATFVREKNRLEEMRDILNEHYGYETPDDAEARKAIDARAKKLAAIEGGVGQAIGTLDDDKLTFMPIENVSLVGDAPAEIKDEIERVADADPDATIIIPVDETETPGA
jgi:hypothetical protein